MRWRLVWCVVTNDVRQSGGGWRLSNASAHTTFKLQTPATKHDDDVSLNFELGSVGSRRPQDRSTTDTQTHVLLPAACCLLPARCGVAETMGNASCGCCCCGSLPQIWSDGDKKCGWAQANATSPDLHGISPAVVANSLVCKTLSAGAHLRVTTVLVILLGKVAVCCSTFKKHAQLSVWRPPAPACAVDGTGDRNWS